MLDALTSPVGALIAVFLLVLANGFFVASEFALVSVRRTRIQELQADGDPRAEVVLDTIADPNRFVSATQVGITMMSLGLGWLGEPAIASLLHDPLSSIGIEGAALHTVSFAIAFFVITFLHVVVGEIAPKALALQYSERVALRIARPVTWFYTVLRPLIALLNGSAMLLLRMVGVDAAPGMHVIHSEEELKMLVSQSSKGGVLEDSEQEMLYNVFDFADTNVAEVMVPRPDVVAFPVDLPPSDLLASIVEQPYTRYPVYKATMDDVLGILHVRDLFNAAERLGKDALDITTLLRPAHVVPESKSLAGLLTDFRRSKSHMALVVDEYGSLAGIVTLEDLIEEIVGDIDDEHDVPEQPVERLGEGHIRVDGKFPLDDLRERFGLDIPDGDYHTVGGFVFAQLGQQPHEGDVITWARTRYEVSETDGPRIVHVDILQMPPPDPEGAENADASANSRADESGNGTQAAEDGESLTNSPARADN